MCGRVTLEFDIDTIKSILQDFFEVEDPQIDAYRSSYNVAPSQELVAVIEHKNHKRAGLLQWGLVPRWSKDERIGSKMINARAETIHEKPSYKEAFEKRRCIVIASCFYEWRQTDKQPFHISMANQPLMMMAGIWCGYKQGDKSLYTCAIVTTMANKAMSELHHRMPVLLDKNGVDQWLNPKTNVEELKRIMKPYVGDMYMRQVSTYVNSVRNDGPECLLAP